MNKTDIRDSIRAEKKGLTREQIKVAGEEVCRKLTNFLPYQETSTVYCYASYNRELPTTDIIRQALRDNKRVALPKVEGENIRFYIITNLNQITPGYQSIPEPDTLEQAIPSSRKPSLMLLPGLAFTKSGDRLGYGGGFYDRYLSTVEQGSIITCGIGYEFQVLGELPVEAYDIPLQYLITSNEIINCKAVEKELQLR